MIMDGWGLSPLKEGNATYLAKTPNLDWIYGNYPKTAISASGIDVGVSADEVGNSEVGHLNLGSGRVVWESLPRIDQSIAKGEFAQNKNLISVLDRVRSNGSSLHLFGLCSAGGVHSSLDHLYAFLKSAKERGVEKVFIHMVTDGRDTAPKVAIEDAKLIQAKIAEIGIGKIATIVGRFYAMDRDKHYERTSKSYNLMVLGQGDQYKTPEEAIEANYRAGADDEKIGTCMLDSTGVIRSGDGLIFINFRSDRMRQMLSAFGDDNVSEFQRQKVDNLMMLTMTSYSGSQKAPIIFTPINMDNVLADCLESNNLTQCHIAETEKYAHVTYFFNGGEEKPHENEDQILVASPRVESYDQSPEMSALQVGDKTIEAIGKNYSFIVVNFANGDMVGHTGNFEATVKAVEVVDNCIGQILAAASAKGLTAIITADHGNCELMINPTNSEINKEHTSSPVPFVLLDLAARPFTPQSGTDFNHETLLEYSSTPTTGILADVSPTVMQILGIAKPDQMSGIDLTSLI
jgi:2,3-bisphosphoglycerate-independent phosphoglycerate mutase